METFKLIALLLSAFAGVTLITVVTAPAAALYVVPYAATVTFLGLGHLRRGVVRG